jgi:hypothetical protein
VSEERDEAPDVVDGEPVHHFVVGPDSLAGGGDLSIVLVEFLADVLDTNFREMPPLQSVIDLDAFEALLGDDNQSIEITFVYERLEVTVSSGHVITIEEVDEPYSNRNGR